MDQSKDCIFCKIIAGQIPAPRVYEDEEFICIKDISPQAEAHLLVIPKQHVGSLMDVYPDYSKMPSALFERALKIIDQQGLSKKGFRSVINTGSGGGQSVFHLHLHLLSGNLGGRFA